MKNYWNKIKSWITLTVFPWLKKNWMTIINIIILIVAISNLKEDSGVQAIVSLWLFVVLTYNLLWKPYNIGELIKKLIEQRKNK